MVRWLRWHCPPDTGFEIRALAVWGRARYLSVTEAPHNTNFHTWMGKKQFCFFQTAETGNRTPDPGVKGSGANHYPRAPARHHPANTARWSNVGPTLAQHWINLSCLLGRYIFNMLSIPGRAPTDRNYTYSYLFHSLRGTLWHSKNHLLLLLCPLQLAISDSLTLRALMSTKVDILSFYKHLHYQLLKVINAFNLETLI